MSLCPILGRSLICRNCWARVEPGDAMDIQIYRLNFQGALHSGRYGVGIEATDHHLGADTLFAALLTQLAAREPALVDDLARAFPTRRGETFTPGDPPFLLTSAFPFVGDVLLFPVPNLPAGEGETIDKSFKKVRYVSQNIFLSLLEGSRLSDFRERALRWQGGQVWIDHDEADGLPAELRQESAPPDLWKTERRPRVAVDRETWQSSIFHHGQVLYRNGCGLWFGVYWREMEYPLGNQTLYDVFNLLMDDLSVAGIGGLRSYGLGAFTLLDKEPRTLALPDTTRDGVVVGLSRFYPTPVDLPRLDDPQAAYKLTHVGGWMRSVGRADRERLTVTMIDEGAVMGGGSMVAGCLVDVRPEDAPHPSWRYGLLFPVSLSDRR